MNDLQSWRIAVGLFNINKRSKTAPKNKFSVLYLSLRMFLFDVFFLTLLMILASLTLTKNLFNIGAKHHRTILFTTLCYYYFKCFIYLFICGDISLNPGPNLTDNHFKTMHWNCNSIVAHEYQRVALLAPVFQMAKSGLQLVKILKNRLICTFKKLLTGKIQIFYVFLIKHVWIIEFLPKHWFFQNFTLF